MVIRKNVRRVVVDVVVTGAHEEPVRGLTKADFAVFEDGKPQVLRSFDLHDFDTAREFIPPIVPPLPPNTFLNLPREPERGPLYVLMYDMVNMETDEQPYARKQLLTFIKNKPAGTRFAIIVLSDRMHLVQGFTDDENKLLATLDPSKNHPHVPQIFLYGRNYGNGDPGFSVSAFTELAHYLEGFPGRKNVIWLSGKFPLRLLGNLGDENVGDGTYTDKVKDIVDTLARDQIAIYPVDVQTAVVTEVFAPTGAVSSGGGTYTDSRGPNSSTATSDSASAPAGATGGQGSAPAASSGGSSHAAGGPGYSQTASQYMAEEELAQMTGGHAYYSKNDLATAMEKAMEHGANYYTLSYSPSNETYNGKLRNIQVSLAKKGYKLSYRRSYFGVDKDARSEPTPATPAVDLAGSRGSIPQDDPLSTAIRHGAPMSHDLIFRAQFHAVGKPELATPEQMSRLIEDPGSLRPSKQNRPAKAEKPIPLQSYTVDYRVLDAQRTQGPSPAAARPTTSIEFAAAAFDVDGNMLSGVLQDAVRNSSGGHSPPNPAGFFRIQQQLDIPLKAAWIRVAVRDLSTNRVGTLEIPLPLAPESPAAITSSSTAAPASAGRPH